MRDVRETIEREGGIEIRIVLFLQYSRPWENPRLGSFPRIEALFLTRLNPTPWFDEETLSLDREGSMRHRCARVSGMDGGRNEEGAW
ncbi:hypothetical protein KM043_009424 [Ampulex compressa]|nr:hypothetical protein KM043_009424 [Ampulex compressa]